MIESGLVLSLARSIAVIVQLLCGGTVYLRCGGYPGPPGSTTGLAALLFPPNLLCQYLCARFAAATLSARLSRNARFVAELWWKTFYYGLPLLAIVLVYDLITCLADVAGTWVDAFVLTWIPCCYIVAMFWGRTIVRRRAIATMQLCPNCRYCLRGSQSAVCPECGRPRWGNAAEP